MLHMASNGILSIQEKPIKKDELLVRWKSTVGDTFESSASVVLLSVSPYRWCAQTRSLTDSGNIYSKGNYLASPSDPELLSYFPASALPIDPASRFADLFLTRSRWKAEDIAPFLADIAIDSKERDKLLLKFTRSITDAQGVWYTARALINS